METKDPKVARDEFAEAFWAQVSKLKEERRMSLSVLADLSGLSRSSLNYALWDKGRTYPTVKSLLGLSIAFQLPPIALIPRFDYDGPLLSFREAAMPDSRYEAHDTRKRFMTVVQRAQGKLSDVQLRSVFSHALSYFDISEEKLLEIEENSGSDTSGVKLSPADETNTIVEEITTFMMDELLKFMKENKLTKKAACKSAGISIAFFSSIASGRAPDLFHLLCVMKVIGLPLERLFAEPIPIDYNPHVIQRLIAGDLDAEKDDYISRIQNVMRFLSNDKRACIQQHIEGLTRPYRRPQKSHETY